MKFDLLKDYNRIAEYAKVAGLSMSKSKSPDKDFIEELTRYVDNANSDMPKINRNHGLAFAIFDDDDKIIGTLCAFQEMHKGIFYETIGVPKIGEIVIRGYPKYFYGGEM